MSAERWADRAALVQIAVATGLVVNAVSIVFFPGVGGAPPHSYLLSHLLVVVGCQLAAAALLARRLHDRAWASTGLALPVVVALWPTAERVSGVGGLAGISLAGVIAVAGWAWLPIGRGSPFVAGVSGGGLGTALLLFRHAHPEGLATDAITLVRYGLPALILLGLGVAATRHRFERVERHPGALLVVALVLTAVTWGYVGAAGFTPPPMMRTGPSSASPPVVLIVLDTVRADRLRSGGYGVDTMPRLDAFARAHAIPVEHGVATSSWSLPSHASMFTGLYPPRHGAHLPFEDDPRGDRTQWYPLGDDIPVLTEILRRAGYWTGAVSSNFGPLDPSYGLARGFDWYLAEPRACSYVGRVTPWRFATDRTMPLAALDRVPPFNACGFFGIADQYRAADEITDEALATVAAVGDAPFFLFVNYYDAHEPLHDRAARFGGRLQTSDRAREQAWRGDGIDPRHLERMNRYYDSELRYLDTQLDRLLQSLQRHPRWDDMLVLITSDHGESLGQRGLINHRNPLYEEMIAVPVVIKPARDRALPDGIDVFQSVDVFPTVIDHVGLPVPAALDGVPWGRGRQEARAWSFVVPDKARVDPDRFGRESQSVRRGDWKLIAYRGGEHELYDLSADPGETRNLVDREPDRAGELAARLWPWDLAVRPDPSGEETDPELLDRLRSLGYVR